MPSYLDVPAPVIDAGTCNNLLPLYQELDGFTLDVNSNRMVAGWEGYTAVLIGYGALQGAAKNDQPGAQAAVAVLAPRFARSTSTAGKAEPKKQADVLAA